MSDEELLSAYNRDDIADAEDDAQIDVDLSMKGRVRAVADAVTEDVRTEMLREIEALEEHNPALRAVSVLPHLIGIDLAKCHNRDKQVAVHVASAIVTALRGELRKMAAESCTGKLDPKAIDEVLASFAVNGEPVAEHASA